MESFEQQDNIDPFEGMSLNEIINDQKNRLENYLQSPQYTKLLSKEVKLLHNFPIFSCEKEIPYGGVTKKYIINLEDQTIIEAKTKKIVYKKFALNKKIYNNMLKSFSLTDSSETNIQESVYDLLDNAYKVVENDTKNKLSIEDNIENDTAIDNEVSDIIQKRAKNLKKTKIHIISDTSNPKLTNFIKHRTGFYVAKKTLSHKELKEDGLQEGHVYISDHLYPKRDLLTPIHEMVHAMTDGNNGMLATTRLLLSKEYSGIENDEYFTNYTEIHARLISIKYLAHKLGIYNAYNEDFTQEVFDKLCGNEYAKQIPDLQELLYTIYPGKVQTILELLHLTADISLNNARITNAA